MSLVFFPGDQRLWNGSLAHAKELVGIFLNRCQKRLACSLLSLAFSFPTIFLLAQSRVYIPGLFSELFHVSSMFLPSGLSMIWLIARHSPFATRFNKPPPHFTIFFRGAPRSQMRDADLAASTRGTASLYSAKWVGGQKMRFTTEPWELYLHYLL
jgi:hypothetical protein